MKAAQSAQPDSLRGPLSASPCQSMHEEPYMTRVPQSLHGLHNRSRDSLLGPARVLSHGPAHCCCIVQRKFIPSRNTAQLTMVTDQRTLQQAFEA